MTDTIRTNMFTSTLTRIFAIVMLAITVFFVSGINMYADAATRYPYAFGEKDFNKSRSFQVKTASKKLFNNYKLTFEQTKLEYVNPAPGPLSKLYHSTYGYFKVEYNYTVNGRKYCKAFNIDGKKTVSITLEPNRTYNFKVTARDKNYINRELTLRGGFKNWKADNRCAWQCKETNAMKIYM